MADSSDGEAAMRFYLRTIGRDIPPAATDYAIPEDQRPSPWTVDFYWHEARLCFEIEGVGHRLTERYHKDIFKYDALTVWGYKVLRATPQQLETNPDKFLSMIRKVMRKVEQ